MMSVGETLRQQRLRRNIQLQEVSDELKISSRMLEAIEADEYHKLPGGVFAKNFVRQYAGVLGLDEEEVASQFQQAVRSPELTRLEELRRPSAMSGLPRMDERRFSDSRPRSVLPSLIAVVVVMLICSAVYGWWRNRQLAPVRQPAPPATQARRATPPPVIHTQQPGTGAGPRTAVATIAAANTPPASATAVPPLAAAVGVGPAQATPAPPPAAQPGVPQPLVPDTEPPGTEAVNVELVATEPVWVSVQRDGHPVFQGELKPNEIRTVAANTEITLKLGNAGGVTILLNGKPIPPPGPKGQVRTVQLTSGGFQIVPPAAPAAPAPRAPALLEPR